MPNFPFPRFPRFYALIFFDYSSLFCSLSLSLVLTPLSFFFLVYGGNPIPGGNKETNRLMSLKRSKRRARSMKRNSINLSLAPSGLGLGNDGSSSGADADFELLPSELVGTKEWVNELTPQQLSLLSTKQLKLLNSGRLFPVDNTITTEIIPPTMNNNTSVNELHPNRGQFLGYCELPPSVYLAHCLPGKKDKDKDKHKHIKGNYIDTQGQIQIQKEKEKEKEKEATTNTTTTTTTAAGDNDNDNDGDGDRFHLDADDDVGNVYKFQIQLHAAFDLPRIDPRFNPKITNLVKQQIANGIGSDIEVPPGAPVLSSPLSPLSKKKKKKKGTLSSTNTVKVPNAVEYEEDMEPIPIPSVYAILYYNNRELGRTKIIHEDVSPLWTEVS
jgi:hypothetical protein